jgi:hypothetical protein
VEQVIFRDRVILDASSSEPFEIFAQLQALMCFPLSTPEERDRIARGICADLIEQQCELEPELAASLRAAFPQYRKSRNRVSLDSHGDRWGEALIAGWYFLVRLNKELTGEHPALNGTPQSVSGRDVVTDMYPPREGGFEENYESRLHDIERHLIRRHYPVAHLAAAFQAAAHAASPNGQAGEFDLHDLGFLRLVVSLARAFADRIGRTAELATVADRLIELAWRD